MRREGSIMIFVLLTFMLITSGSLLGLYMASEQIEIASNSHHRIQSQYSAESKLNKILHEEKYFEGQLIPSILKYDGSNKNPRYSLEASDLLFDDSNLIKGEFYDYKNNIYLKLTSTGEYKGIKSEAVALGPVFNEIFYDGNPALSYNTIRKEHLDGLHLFMDKISEEITLEDLPSNIMGMELKDYHSVKMQVKSTFSKTYNIITITNMYEEDLLYEDLKYDDPVFMVVRNSSHAEKALLKIDDKVYFRGILYVEGDLIIRSPFRFLGIIIVKGDIIMDIDSNDKPDITGIVLHDGNLDLNEWKFNHNETTIHRYGIYLPNYIEPKLDTYKYY